MVRVRERAVNVISSDLYECYSMNAMECQGDMLKSFEMCIIISVHR